MSRSIAVVNQKGGVGKTTTTVNLTAALAGLGKRVLLCDFDPQANATSGMGVDKSTASPTVYDVLIAGAEPEKAVISTKFGDVLPSNKSLAGAGVELIGLEDPQHLLKKALARFQDQYDYILLAPQIAYKLPEYRAKYGDRVMTVDSRDFASSDVGRVLNRLVRLGAPGAA